jgi:hypothetical protein
MLVPTTFTVTDAELPFTNVPAFGVPTVLPEAVGEVPLFTWPTMTAPLCPMAFLRDGAVGDKEASPAQEVAKIAEVARSRPRSGVRFIESCGSPATPVPVLLW